MEFQTCGEIGRAVVAALVLAIIVIFFSGCATTQTGNETSAVRHGLSRIRGDAKEAIALTGSIEQDAKQIRRILNQ
jgi:hypothetical protein